MNSETQNGLLQSDNATAGRFGRRAVRLVAGLAALGSAGLLLWTSLVFVDESEYVVVERLGDIVQVYDRPEDRGLKFKLPWPIDAVRRFDRRIRLYSPPGRERPTRDQKNVTVATYVCWRIARPSPDQSADFSDRPVVRFYQVLGGPRVAESKIDELILDILNSELSRIEFSDLFSALGAHTGPADKDRGRLAEIADRVRSRLERGGDGRRPLGTDFGIEIVDLRIRRLNLPRGNLQAVYDRMRSERRRESDRIHSEGIAANQVIRSRADLQYERVLASARADAERIRGSAEAEAIAIRNAAHARDAEFYVALRTLQTYKRILNDRTTLVLSASSELLRMLTDGIPKSKRGPENPKKSPASSDDRK
ncbi:MAG: protease modulator HflC [Planctomycetaceae bacterium]